MSDSATASKLSWRQGKDPAVLFVCGFGSGFVPFAPGTNFIGMLIAVPTSIAKSPNHFVQERIQEDMLQTSATFQWVAFFLIDWVNVYANIYKNELH